MVARAVPMVVTAVAMARARIAVASARRGRGEDRALLRGLCPRMTPAAPGLSIPLRFIPASAVALRRERVQSNRNEEGCRLCPPEPMAAHGHVNGWREAPGWSEAEGFGGHSLQPDVYCKSNWCACEGEGGERVRGRMTKASAQIEGVERGHGKRVRAKTPAARGRWRGRQG